MVLIHGDYWRTQPILTLAGNVGQYRWWYRVAAGQVVVVGAHVLLIIVRIASRHIVVIFSVYRRTMTIVQ